MTDAVSQPPPSRSALRGAKILSWATRHAYPLLAILCMALWLPGILTLPALDRDERLARPWATPGTPLRTVMLAMHRAETAPVALFDETERFVGAIGVRDVLQAVLRRQPD